MESVNAELKTQNEEVFTKKDQLAKLNNNISSTLEQQRKIMRNCKSKIQELEATITQKDQDIRAFSSIIEKRDKVVRECKSEIRELGATIVNTNKNYSSIVEEKEK